MKNYFFIYVACCLFVFLQSCGNDPSANQTTLGKTSLQAGRLLIKQNSQRELPTVEVFDSKTKEPIHQAIIIIETAEEKFTAYTNEDGIFNIPEGIMTSEKMNLTVGATDYSLITLYRLKPQNATYKIPLNHYPVENEKVMVKGYFKKWHPKKNWDGVIDFGIFLPTLDMNAIFNLDPSSLLGPSQYIDIFGPREIPSNVVFPSQWEYVIKLKKEYFYLPMEKDTPETVLGLTASIPANTLLEISKKNKKDLDAFEILKNLRLRKLGLQMHHWPCSNSFGFDLNYFLDPTLSVTTELPDRSKVVNISLASPELHPMMFIPTGFSVVDSMAENSKPLTTAEGLEALHPSISILSVASHLNEENKPDAYSMIFNRDIQGNTVTLNRYQNYFNLTLSEKRDVLSNNFENTDGASVSYTKLISYRKLENGEIRSKTHWEIISPADTKDITLPEVPESHLNIDSIVAGLGKEDSLRFIHLIFKTKEALSVDTFSREKLMNTVTHISVSEVEIK